MKVLIASVDSDIGAAIQQQYAGQPGVEVDATSRNRKGIFNLELVHPLTWPNLPAQEYDIIYFTIGINDARASRMEVMQINAYLTCDFLGSKAANAVKPGGKIVVLSSEWSSIQLIRSAKAASYRMSKVAMNMGVAVLATRFPKTNWILMHPGFVDTKMTRSALPTDNISAAESAAGIIKSAEAYNKQFGFINYLGNEVPF